MDSHEDKAQAFTQEFMEIANTPITIETTGLAAWTCMSCLQLALRHPDIGENLRPIIEDLAHQIADALPLGPTAREAALAGFDPAQDIYPP